MAETEQDQKTEEATGKRLQEARDEGQLPISRELSTWTLFVAGFITVIWLAPAVSDSVTASLRVFIERPHQFPIEGPGLQPLLFALLGKIGLATAVMFLLFLAAAIGGIMVQTGFYMNPVKLEPDIKKLSLIKGLNNLFSLNTIVELIKSVFKLIVLGFITVKLFIPMVREIPAHVGHDLRESLGYMRDEARHLILVLMSVITVIAVVDFLYQRFQYFKGLRMTKQEVKDENKQMEGDPMVKGRQRQIRMEKARKRMMSKVPKADVVITNPTHYAVALQYDNKSMMAPVVLAKGIDHIALRIREMAEEHHVTLVSNPPLARTLYDTVELDAPIQPEHYRAVAEVISYVYKLKKKVLS